jgi:hypothetical protein
MLSPDSALRGRRKLLRLLDAVGNNAKHDHHSREQPNNDPDVLPRISDVVLGAATVLALLFFREDAHQDDYANAD